MSGNCSTCFGWYFHPSSGAHTTVSTASCICHNAVTGICRYRGRVGTGLSVLWVAYATHSTLKLHTFFLGLLFYSAFSYPAEYYVVVLSCLLRKSICCFVSIYPGVSFHPFKFYSPTLIIRSTYHINDKINVPKNNIILCYDFSIIKRYTC
jgi:hypothetical protein